MKKIHLLLLGLTISIFSACHNELWDAIDGLDSRVTKLEELCKEMNTNITSLQTIVDVLQSNDFITSIVEIKKDGEVVGYTITFGKHDPITIYHGQDGKDGQNGQNGADGKDGQDGQNGADGKDGITPVIGVAQDTDGVYYWTLNGEWLLDDNGNKLPVSGKDGQNGANGSNGQDGADGKDGQDGEDGKDGADGQDGKDGITPQLKIEEGYWYISYDNGVTWTQLGKATGEDGKDGANGADGKDGQDGTNGKDGQDGDSMFQSVTQDEKYVYFTLSDGTIITVAKHADQKKVDLVMFMGQSNMAGRGVASESVVVKEGHGYEFRAISDPTKLYPVVEPFGVNENNSNSGVVDDRRTGSLVSAFIEEYYTYRKTPIVGVSCSKGGTATSFWLPGNKPLNDAIARHDSAKVWLEKNGYTIEHDYMVWLQGEHDGYYGVSAEQYAENLESIIEDMVDKTGIEFCAIIRVGHTKHNPSVTPEIIKSQTNLCKTYEKAVMVSTILAGCTNEMKDIWHFTQPVYNRVGADAGKHTAFYINNGVKPSMYDPEYDNYFPYGETVKMCNIERTLGKGAKSNSDTKSIARGEPYYEVITLDDGYTFGMCTVTMNENACSPDFQGDSMIIDIPEVLGDIRIYVTTMDNNNPTEETWYIDHRNNMNQFTTNVNVPGRGWCHQPGANAHSAIVNRPINLIGFFTNMVSQDVTIGVCKYKQPEDSLQIVGTYTVTNPNGTTKSFVTLKLETPIVLSENECLCLFAQEDPNIQFFYSTSGAVTDANGIVDANFVGRVPKVYGSGTAWTEYTAGNLCLGISYGYAPLY